jgi:CRISPR-associated exonuclease Cas4
MSDVVEHLFCPRFTYYIHCLGIPQREGRLFKVLKGREVHKRREKSNVDYLRKELGVQRKESGVYLRSNRLHLRGIIDEILFRVDGSASPLDFKYARYRKSLFRTHRTQSILFGLMIEEQYDVPSYEGFVCYTRSGSRVETIAFTEKSREEARQLIGDILEVIQTGAYPRGAKGKAKCVDCCYRRICDHP